MTDERESRSLAGAFPVVPQQDRALLKRQALLNAARALFAERGYEKTTAKDIARRAGVAVGTFYRYFTDKRQILLAILQERLDELLPATPQWLSDDPEAVLVSLLERHFHQKQEFGLHGALQELVLRDPELARALHEVRQQAHARLVDGLRQARARGLTWPDTDLDATAWAILTLVEQGSETYHPDRDPAGLRHLARLICRLVMPPAAVERLRSGAGGGEGGEAQHPPG